MEYDDRRNLTKFTDAFGNVSTVTYNSQNDIVTKTDALGHKVVYEYDANGNRTVIVDQLGYRTLIEPDRQGRTTSLTTPNGQSWRYEYSVFDFPDRTIHPDGTSRTTAYNANGELTGITDENGKTSLFKRDSAGRQTSSIDPLGNSFQIGYGQGLAQQMTDQLGWITRFEYDLHGRVIREIDPLGYFVTTEYDANDRIIARIDENGNRTSWEYDKNNRAVKQINALGFATRKTYDPNGNVIEDIDSSGAITTYGYDPLNRLISTTLPDGSVIRTHYDAIGRITSTVGPRGETTTYEYDAANQLIRVTDPMLGVYLQSFDATGNLISTTDPRGNSTTRAYDSRNRLIQITDAAGYQVKFEPDDIGRIIKYTDQEGSQTSYLYDARGKVISLTTPDGGVTQFEYDAKGNRVKVVDPLGRISTNTYDPLDRPQTTVDPKGATTLVQYDAAGNLTHLTDASGNTTEWKYDVLNRVRQSIDPLGGTEEFIYDNVALACGCVQANGRGHLSEYIDKIGRHTVYKYDVRNRIREAIYRDVNDNEVDRIEMDYDASSNLTSISDGDSQLRFTYDLNSRPLTADNSATPGVRAVTLTNTWDEAGNRIRVNDGDGVAVASTYDPRNLLKNRTWSGASTGNAGIVPARVDFTYNGRSQATQVLRSANSTGTQVVSKTLWAYDSVGRVGSISHQSAIDAIMAKFDTDWNIANELAAWTIDGNKSTYEYDLTGQLTKADHVTPGLPDESFEYDATGNRAEANKTVGPNNRLMSDERFDYSYDAEGNTISKLERASGNEQRFQYDHHNRMTQSELRSSTGLLLNSIEYRFDAFGRRISRKVDSDGSGPQTPRIQTFVYDGSDVWLDADGSGAITARYLHGDNVDELIARYRPEEGTAWYLTDHLGSVRAIADASGTIIDRITYDSFGTIVSESSSIAGDRFKFTGREWDAEAGLYYYRSRMYDPSSGRFLSEDQIGFASGDVNLHRYVGNMPGAYSDPSGNIAMADYGGALGFSRIAVALASGLAGFTFGYTCGYLDAVTIQGLKGPEAEFYAKREGLLVGSIDFAASITLNLKGTVGSKIFGVALFASGSLGLTVATQLASGKKTASGPAIVASNICTAISVVGGYNAGQAAGRIRGTCKVTRPKNIEDAITQIDVGSSNFLVSQFDTMSSGPTALMHEATSGTLLRGTLGRTTTVLGSFKMDIEKILAETGNVKSLDFGAKPGSFNILNVPDHLYVNGKQFWNDFNQPWLDAALSRNDIFMFATKPEMSVLKRLNPATGKWELSGFGREYLYLRKHGVKCE